MFKNRIGQFKHGVVHFGLSIEMLLNLIPPPWTSGYGRRTPCPCLKLRCAGGREFEPDRGNIVG